MWMEAHRWIIGVTLSLCLLAYDDRKWNVGLTEHWWIIRVDLSTCLTWRVAVSGDRRWAWGWQSIGSLVTVIFPLA